VVDSKSTVCIIDDDRSTLIALANLVRSMGWSVRLFDSGKAFLQVLDLIDVACLVSDIQMPEIDGLDMQDRLLELGKSVPIIFVCANPTVAIRERALANGALEVLEKPVDADVLFSYLNTCR
jgi:FixJ family two-component response regulator